MLLIQGTTGSHDYKNANVLMFAISTVFMVVFENIIYFVHVSKVGLPRVCISLPSFYQCLSNLISVCSQKMIFNILSLFTAFMSILIFQLGCFTCLGKKETFFELTVAI